MLLLRSDDTLFMNWTYRMEYIRNFVRKCLLLWLVTLYKFIEGIPVEVGSSPIRVQFWVQKFRTRASLTRSVLRKIYLRKLE